MGYSYGYMEGRKKGTCVLYASSTDRVTHTTAFITPVVEHWLEERKIVFYLTTVQSQQHCYLRVIMVRSGSEVFYGCLYDAFNTIFTNVRSWCDGSSNRSFMADPLKLFLFPASAPRTGVTKAILCVILLYEMMHIKEPLQLIGKSSPCE